MESKIIIGISGWLYPDWKGLFYPKDLPKSQWFDYYQSHFKIVEINATFYRNNDYYSYAVQNAMTLKKMLHCK